MPGLDGIEVCRRIGSSANRASTAIVAVTGCGQEESRRRTQAAGFDAHLVKPVAPDALLVTGRPRCGAAQELTEIRAHAGRYCITSEY